MAFSLNYASPVVAALMPGNPVEISVKVVSPLGLPSFSADRGGPAFSFHANVYIPPGSINVDGDLYFGVITPDGEVAYTWAKEGEEFSLSKGMRPILKDIWLGEESAITTFDIVGHDLSYELPEQLAPGMYYVFALLVGAGMPPADPQNWIQVGMTPLVVQ